MIRQFAHLTSRPISIRLAAPAGARSNTCPGAGLAVGVKEDAVNRRDRGCGEDAWTGQARRTLLIRSWEPIAGVSRSSSRARARRASALALWAGILAAFTISAFGGIVESAAAAETPLATITTTGCPTTAPAWRIGYRLYFDGTQSEGAPVEPTTREAIPDVLAQTRGFADDVGRSTGCAMNVIVDVSDMGSARWFSSPTDALAPDDYGTFLRHGHDSVFYRFPAHLEEPFCADTQQDTSGGIARFLVDATGTTSCAAGTIGPLRRLLMAAWVQHLIGFYEPRQGWPAVCKPGFDLFIPCTPSLYYEDYLERLLQGRLTSGTRTIGIQSDEWAAQGTPRHPLIRPTPLTFTLTDDGVRLTYPRPPGRRGAAAH